MPSLAQIIWDDPYRLILEEVWEDALRITGFVGQAAQAVTLTPERDVMRSVQLNPTILGNELRVRRSDRWSNAKEPLIIPPFGTRFEHRSESYRNGTPRLVETLDLVRSTDGLFINTRPLQANGSITRARGSIRLSHFWQLFQTPGAWSNRRFSDDDALAGVASREEDVELDTRPQQ